MIGRRGLLLRTDTDMALLNTALDVLADPLPVSVVLDEFAPVQCRVRWYSLAHHGLVMLRTPMMTTPCPHAASFEAMCRTCGAGGPCCAEHEQQIITDPDVTCGMCDATGLGADLYVFIPLGP